MTENIVRLATAEFADFSEEEARAHTDTIKRKAEALWSLLLVAHDRKAWKALGYANWGAYIDSEFDMHRSRSYHLLDQGRVIKAIEEAARMSTDVDISEPEQPIVLHISEAAARDIKPVIDQVTERIREVAPNVPRAMLQAVVNDVVSDVRIQRMVDKANVFKEARADAKALAEELGLKDDPEDTANILLIQTLHGALDDIDGMPSPADVAAKIKPYQADYFDHLGPTITWLKAFQAEVQR